MQVKKCKNCEKVKTLKCFTYAENNSDGFTTNCRKCITKKQRQYKLKSQSLDEEIRSHRVHFGRTYKKKETYTFGNKTEAYNTEDELLNGIPEYNFKNLSNSEKLIYLNSKA